MLEVIALARAKPRGFFQCSNEAQGSSKGDCLWVSCCGSGRSYGSFCSPFFWVFAGVLGWVFFVLFVCYFLVGVHFVYFLCT
jgi:hypothetical protein